MKKKMIALGLFGVMCISTLTACDSQEWIRYFNKKTEVSVDNVTENTENRDNSEDVGADGGGTEAVAETEQEESVYDGPEISVIMVGDMLMHTPVEKSSLQEDGTYNYDAIFANTNAKIKEADLAIVNEEVIIGGEKLGISGYPAFNAPYELGAALVETGFDVICHGTNHALDKGKKGLNNCLSFWQENYPDIAVLGIHDSKEDQEEIYVYEQDGVKIAVLNFTYGTNGIALPSDMPYAVDLLEEEKVVAALDKAEELADFTIVCPHWGTEYELGITSQQKKWCAIFMEHGVDLVLGTHPHVIEPIEVLVDEETGHSMLVYYSLGNFVNWTSSSGEGIANRMVGGMAEVTIGTDESGETIILDYGVEPVICHLTEGTNGVTVFFFDDYSVELGKENLIINQDSNFSYEYCVALCDQIWGEIWRK